MAKQIALGKRLKISEAQQYMLLAVLGAGLAFGVSIVVGIYFIKYIRLNSVVVSEKDKAITGYSELIHLAGVCSAPRGSVYTDTELKHCRPNEVKLDELAENTLRVQVMSKMAKDETLESVARESVAICYNNIGEKYSEKYWTDKIANAVGEDLRQYYSQAFGICSALRVIPDALPSTKNKLALMASLDRIFEISTWTPTSLSPGIEKSTDVPGLGAIEVNLSVNSDGSVTQTVLSNIEKSIREFSINTATIEWTGDDQLKLEASATAYYTEEVELDEQTTTIKNVNGDWKVTRTTRADKEAN